MKLILKNGLAIFQGDGYAPKKNLIIAIEGAEGNKKCYGKINKLPRNVLEKKAIKIPKELLNNDSLFIEITVEDLDTGKSETYKSNKIDLNKAVIIGTPIEEMLPTSLETLKADIGSVAFKALSLEKTVKKLDKRIKNLEEEGDLI